MNRAKFFDAIRPAMGPMERETVAGIEALLDAGKHLPLHLMANVLANVRRETGGWMAPIKETVMPWHKDKNPTDAEVIRRLDRAFAARKLPGVKSPYWRDGEFGRGQIQLTHASNRAKFGISNRDDLLNLDVSAQVAVTGMRMGLFTGRKMGDYDFPRALANPPDTNPRRIVNGRDGSDAEVAASHHMFAAALVAGGYDAEAPVQPVADYVQATPAKPEPSRWASLWAALATLFAGKP